MQAKGREAWILGALLIVFVAAMAHYAERGFEAQQEQRPSTYSVAQPGIKALYQLLEREGVRVGRMERPLTRLPADAGLLIMVEPLARDPAEAEEQALARWVEGGGALLLVASQSYLGRGLDGTLLEGLVPELKTPEPTTLAPEKVASPCLADVRELAVEGALRVGLAKGTRGEALVADDAGAYAVSMPRGRGTVIVTTDGLGVSNRQLALADNAVFYVNIARAHANSRPVVLFDEYHQGIGEEQAGPERSLWQAVGAPARAAVWYGLVIFLLVVYNANRRFGSPRRMDPPAARASTEYIASMAHLFRRAGQPEIALETLYRDFARDLAHRVDAPPGAGAERLAELGAARFGWDVKALRQLLARCEKVAGGEKATEHEMLQIARQIQDYRRRAELVRLS